MLQLTGARVKVKKMEPGDLKPWKLRIYFTITLLQWFQTMGL